jgi:hypothetical protein
MSSRRYSPDEVARAEALVGRIRGISSCHIAADETGGITEVHVLSTVAKPPKLVARDVQSCLKAGLGMGIDYKKISVVPVEDKKPQDQPVTGLGDEPIPVFPIEEHTSRFAFHSVNLFVSQDSIQAEVELVRDGIETFGKSKSENVGVSPLVVVAEATLKAVEEVIEEHARLCFSDVAEIELGGEPAVVVKVDLLKQRDKKGLVGCAIYSGNANQTAVYATLDAINRVVGKLKTKSSIEYKIK